MNLIANTTNRGGLVVRATRSPQVFHWREELEEWNGVNRSHLSLSLLIIDRSKSEDCVDLWIAILIEERDGTGAHADIAVSFAENVITAVRMAGIALMLQPRLVCPWPSAKLSMICAYGMNPCGSHNLEWTREVDDRGQSRPE